ncbi:MAG: hypothetical protein GY753_12770 [Gammaproteobacteria bacterium]|nr:hypothetical protein [Gammaproteobacteria bacterium]
MQKNKEVIMSLKESSQRIEDMLFKLCTENQRLIEEVALLADEIGVLQEKIKPSGLGRLLSRAARGGDEDG